MNYPNMSLEIIEAIHTHFKNYPDTERDCYLSLIGASRNPFILESIVIEAQEYLEKNNLCSYCGTPLESYTYNEIHTELEGHPAEIITEVYCPNCDIGGGGYC